MKRDVLENAVALRERFDLRILAPRGDAAAFEKLGVPIVRWNPVGLTGVFFGIRTLRRVTESFAPDAIVAHNFSAVALALGTYPKSLASRTIAVFHDPLRERELPSKLVDKRLGKDLRRAARLVAVNPAFARVIERRFGLAEGSVEVIPHGIATPLDPAPAARPPNRPGPILGWNGPLNAERGWEVVIDTLWLLRKDLPDARLLISGTGPTRQLVVQHARERKVAAFVDIRKDLTTAQLFAAIDLLLVPSALDAQPHVLLEAAASGVPVIAGNVGALADALRELEGAWLVPDDAEGLAEGVRDAWPRIDAAWSAGMAQRGLAQAAYAREVVQAKSAALFEAVASAGAGGATASGGS
jgi:glycosyltransferase involved in cell wall biosynthesis